MENFMGLVSSQENSLEKLNFMLAKYFTLIKTFHLLINSAAFLTFKKRKKKFSCCFLPKNRIFWAFLLNKSSFRNL